MPRAKKAGPPALVPLEAKVLKRKRVSLKNLGVFKDQVLAEYAPVLIPELMVQLRKKVNDGSGRELQTGLKMYGLVAPSGPSVVINNSNTANANAAAGSGGPRSFDSIARKLHEVRSAKTAVVSVAAVTEP